MTPADALAPSIVKSAVDMALISNAWEPFLKSSLVVNSITCVILKLMNDISLLTHIIFPETIQHKKG